MNILVTGIEGFVGSHLAEYLLASQPQASLHGTIRPKASMENIAHLGDRLKLHEIDITDNVSVYRLLETIRPEVIYHLAAQSYVRTSWESPQATLITNIIGQTNFLENLRLIRDSKYDPIFLIPSSSEVYGKVAEKDLPVQESYPLQPLSPYAVSKIGQDLLGYQYYQSYGLKTVRLRVFNHTGPRRPTAFGDSYVAHTIALIEKGLAEPVLTYRDLSATRDYTDVRDIVRAYHLATLHCQPGEVYNVCSGQGTSIQKMYNALLSYSTNKNIELRPDPSGPRPTDGGALIGNNQRFVAATGWQPQFSFLEQTLPDILNYWRERVTTHETVRAYPNI